MNENTEKRLAITKYELLGKLPDPFLLDSGRRVSSREEWELRRREIYKTAVELQYGTQPPKPEFLEVETLYRSPTNNTFEIRTGTRKDPVSFRLKLILPKGVKNCPVIVDGDLCFSYAMNADYIAAAIDKGIAWAFFDRTEIVHDIQHEGRKGQLYKTYPDYTFGALGAWAWGYSRVVDALEQLALPEIDLGCVVFTGHSRGGKTAALAGVLDERAVIVNPNETCAGACGCYRIHMRAVYGDGEDRRSEPLADLWKNFDFWLGPEMEKYKDDEAALPFDCHFLKALVAPRILFVSEATGDIWANPVGSWQTTKAAEEVYKFLGVPENLFWYYRPGFHAHEVSDVEMLVNIILHKRDGEPIDERFHKLPFDAPELAFDWSAPKI